MRKEVCALYRTLLETHKETESIPLNQSGCPRRHLKGQPRLCIMKRAASPLFNSGLLTHLSSSPVYFLPPEWLSDLPISLLCFLVSCLVHVVWSHSDCWPILWLPCPLLLLWSPHYLDFYQFNFPYPRATTHTDFTPQVPTHLSVHRHYIPAAIILPTPKPLTSANQ